MCILEDVKYILDILAIWKSWKQNFSVYQFPISKKFKMSKSVLQKSEKVNKYIYQ